MFSYNISQERGMKKKLLLFLIPILVLAEHVELQKVEVNAYG